MVPGPALQRRTGIGHGPGPLNWQVSGCPQFAAGERYDLPHQRREVVQHMNDASASCGTLEVAGR
jgi:hypothetical protein